jgi:hypothetical protein
MSGLGNDPEMHQPLIFLKKTDQEEQHIDQPIQAETTQVNEEGSDSGGGEAAGDADQFCLDEDLLLYVSL